MSSSVVAPAAATWVAPPAALPATPARRWWPLAFTPPPAWLHLLLLLVLLVFDGLLYYFQVVVSDKPLTFNTVWVVRNGVLDLLTAALFYGNWLVLMPLTLARGRVAAYLGAVLLAVAAFDGLRLAVSSLVYWVLARAPDLAGHYTELFMLLTVINLSIVLLSSALYLTLDYVRSQRRRHELAGQQLYTELSLLKAQLNPHFLFNTLNNIYSLTSRKSDRAPEAVLQLAENMRYLLYESAAETLPLARELHHLRGYLDLQRLRLPPADAATALGLHVQAPPEALQAPVAPLLLLPLVENAFKHGDLAARPEAVRLDLDVTATGLCFRVHNYLPPTPPPGVAAGGVGLPNLRRRLALLYPGRHALHLHAGPAAYTAELHLRWA